jgi:RND family efflux transporter MFP subunit
VIPCECRDKRRVQFKPYHILDIFLRGENMNLTKKIIMMIMLVSIILYPFLYVNAQPKQEKDRTAFQVAAVVVSEVKSGLVAPVNEFVGTVYYKEVSDISSEVSGVVDAVHLEEGQRVKKGEVLVTLSSDLLEKSVQASRASYEKALIDLEKASKELKRAEGLYKESLISEETYDEKKFLVSGLQKQSLALKAETERLERELEKKKIRAPYEGIIIKKYVDLGEWVSPGTTVVTMAKDTLLDIVVEVPEEIIRFITEGLKVSVSAGGKTFKGKVITIIPRGSVSTRTIPVKIRAKNSASLIEGMETRVILPVAKKQEMLTVPRDAIVTVFGTTAVFAVIESKAVMIPVKVMGYEGMTAGVLAEGLKQGMSVVIKGNERLMDGQMVKIQTPSTK